MKIANTIRSISIILVVAATSIGCATTNTSPQELFAQKQVKACSDEFFKHRTPYITAENAYHIQTEIRQDCRKRVHQYMADVAARADEINALAQAEVKETRSE